jgi:small conductance mechanosensitive channel
LFDFIIQKLKDYWNNTISVIPELLIGIVILFVFYLLAGFVLKIIRNKLHKRIEDRLLVIFISNIIKTVIIIIGIMFFMKVVGLASFIGGFVGGAAISAIVIGFAFKDIIENFLAGIILAFNRPFKTGDTIVSGDVTGNIIDFNIRYTHMKTFEGFDVYVPNSIIINKPLINYTRDGMRRFDFLVNIDYGSDIGKATQIIMKVVDDTKEIIKEPAPMIIMDSFNPSYVVLKVLYWVDNNLLDRSQFLVKSDLMQNINSELKNNGINMPISSVMVRGGKDPVGVNVIK